VNTVLVVGFVLLAALFLVENIVIIIVLGKIGIATQEAGLNTSESICELNNLVSEYTKTQLRSRTNYPVSMEPGVYFPSEEDIYNSAEADIENRERALTNPYRTWEVFDGKEEAR
jgi:hypothetical protein